MKAVISFFISLLFSFFVVFFTNITSTLAFRELAVEHGISVTFVLVFLAVLTISFAVILLLYSLSKLVIDELEYFISTTINDHSKYIKNYIVEYLVKHYTNIFNKVETIKVYNKNTISLITNLHDTLEHKLDKLLALSTSPANELPTNNSLVSEERLVLPKPLKLALSYPVEGFGGLKLNAGDIISITAIRLNANFNSGVALETDKGLLDMGLFVDRLL